jgi:hypothetical protein
MPFFSFERFATGGLNVGSFAGGGAFVQSEMPDFSNGAELGAALAVAAASKTLREIERRITSPPSCPDESSA